MQRLKGPWCVYWGLYLLISARILGCLASFSATTLPQLFNLPPTKRVYLSVLALSIAGFPPTIGFYLKILLLATVAQSGTLVLRVLLTLGAALYFYLSLVIASWLS